MIDETAKMPIRVFEGFPLVFSLSSAGGSGNSYIQGQFDPFEIGIFWQICVSGRIQKGQLRPFGLGDCRSKGSFLPP